MTPTLRIRPGRWSMMFYCMLPLLSLNTVAQDTITIGTGTEQNGLVEYPAPYGNAQQGARHQLLILADELQAAGMVEGNIWSVGFDVAQAAFTVFTDLNVSIGTTAEVEMAPQWIPGLTPVFGPVDFTNDQAGWTQHTFDAPFLWDGTSNLVVQVCFYNEDMGANAIHNQTATSFASTLWRSTPNPNVCTAETGTLITDALRPNLRFTWSSLDIPPVASFAQSTTSTCTGGVQFTDNSEYTPDTWFWDFGDGTTDTVQNPEHQYTSDGVFLPILIAANAFGTDTVEGQPITVSISVPLPVTACEPNSTGTISGFGILSITLADLTVASADSQAEGYTDRTCQGATVLAGTNMLIALETGTVATHNVRVWVDWDNSGDYIGTEEVLSATSVLSASANVTVPSFAVLDTPLRARFMADYDFGPALDPCTGPQFGQAEDYALTVLANPVAPVAAFVAAPSLSCDGSVQFSDLSTNIPSSWEWDLGDGSTSIEPSPLHVYLTSGSFDVRLIVTNANGADTLVQTGLVTVDLSAQLVPAQCLPATQDACCGYGLTSLVFAGINSTSGDGSEGYVDRSCGNTAEVTEGASYPISAGTGGVLEHDVIMWMDLDNNGTFGTDEQVWSALDQQDPSSIFVMPSGSVFGIPVRLRIAADVVGQTIEACDGPFYGQMEDFSVIVTENTDPPVADFSATPTTTCNGYVQFTDASTNAPSTWLWDFGDGTTSDEPSPLHLYTEAGIYTVSLTVESPDGMDMLTNVDHIQYLDAWMCDTLQVPNGGAMLVETCPGILSDDGGPEAPYQPGDSDPITIAPLGADVVTLIFSQFQWGNNDARWLAIYDGPDVFSPLIDEYSGNGLVQLPNNGIITSTGPAITLRQESDGGGPPPNSAGFLLTWECGFTGLPEAMPMIGQVWPQPADATLTIRLAAPAAAGTRIALHDALGSQVLDQAVVGTDMIHLNVEHLAPGPYVLGLTAGDARWNRTILIN